MKTGPQDLTDTDGDGVIDSQDAFPNDASESQDSDEDGVGDNSDIFPYDPNESIDTDGDGIGDNSDLTPNGEGNNEPIENVKLGRITFVNISPNDNSVHLHWGDANGIRFRILLMSHNQSPVTFETTVSEYTFTDLSVFDGVNSIIIEAYDSLGSSVFSSSVNVEDL